MSNPKTKKDAEDIDQEMLENMDMLENMEMFETEDDWKHLKKNDNKEHHDDET